MSSPLASTTRSGSGPLDSFFKITERGSTVGREIRGGLVTFFTMAYIVVLNPLIIGTVKDGAGHVPRRRHRPTAATWRRSRPARRWSPA